MKGRIGELNKHSTQFGASKTAGGQAPVHHTQEGHRRSGDANARGAVSPLGGVSNRSSGDMSRGEEGKDRVQAPRRISESGIFKRFQKQPDKPI